MKRGRLEAEVQGARLVLGGRIDDGAAVLGELARQLPAGDVTIDTGAVTFVNSIGMREWMRMIRALRERGAVTLERVADVLITQINMHPELARSVRIASFHAQYVCTACGAEGTPLVDVAVHGEALSRLAPPRLPCPECVAPMELADFPERYLSVFRDQGG